MKPTVFINLIDGTTYGPDNPGGVRGDWLHNPNGLLEKAHLLATRMNIDSITLMLPCGKHEPVDGQPCNFVASTVPILKGFYLNSWLWLNETFPELKKKGWEYNIYVGGRCTIDEDQERYCVPWDSRIPSPEFYKKTLDGLQTLFDWIIIDALGGDPALQEHFMNIRLEVEKDGHRLATEMFPHTGIVTDGSFDIDRKAAKVAPFVMLMRHFGITTFEHRKSANFFADRFEGVDGADLHLIPMHGDTNINAETIERLLCKGVRFSPQLGFEDSNPTVVNAISKYYRMIRQIGSAFNGASIL